MTTLADTEKFAEQLDAEWATNKDVIKRTRSRLILPTLVSALVVVVPFVYLFLRLAGNNTTSPANKKPSSDFLMAIPKSPAPAPWKPLMVQDLFVKQAGTRQPSVNDWLSQRGDVKPNYLQQYLVQQEVGLAGEEFVLAFEKSELVKMGRADLAEKVVHVSQLLGDQYGYDILSFDRSGAEKQIEVKSTQASYDAAFYLTENKLAKIKETPTYYIYRVYRFDLEKRSGEIYVIHGLLELFAYFSLEPSGYRVSPNYVARVRCG